MISSNKCSVDGIKVNLNLRTNNDQFTTSLQELKTISGNPRNTAARQANEMKLGQSKDAILLFVYDFSVKVN